MRDYEFGNTIAAYRCKQGLSQYQLGKLVGVSDKAVSKWENGSSKPKMSTCRKLAHVFGITLDELMTPSDCPDIKRITTSQSCFAPSGELSETLSMLPGYSIKVLPSYASPVEDAVQVILLAITPAGAINLGHILRSCLVLANDPTPYVLKEIIDSHREGILVGYCCFGVYGISTFLRYLSTVFQSVPVIRFPRQEVSLCVIMPLEIW